MAIAICTLLKVCQSCLVFQRTKFHPGVPHTSNVHFETVSHVCQSCLFFQRTNFLFLPGVPHTCNVHFETISHVYFVGIVLPPILAHLVLKYMSLDLGRTVLVLFGVDDSLHLGTKEKGVSLCCMEQYLKPVKP
jgi:hypothetical protein